MSMSNALRSKCGVGWAIDIIHKERGYCSFCMQTPENQGNWGLMHRYA